MTPRCKCTVGLMFYFTAYLPRTPAAGNTASRLWRGCHNSATSCLSCVAGLPPSPRERVSKYLYPPRFHCEAACQSRFWGRVHRSGSRRHRAAPHVADRLQSRGICARCTVYSVVKDSQEVLLLTIQAVGKTIWQRLTQIFSNSCNMTTDILM